MSSSNYGPGLQSCLEPVCLVEPRVLRLKLAPSKSNDSRSSTIGQPSVTDSDCDLESNKNADTGCWSFLQAIANNTSQTTTKENDKVYFPPNYNRSPSILNEKSLEMCTESLGCETGSEVSESSDEMAFLSLENMNYETSREAAKLRETRRTSRNVTFPPPLSSISGSSNVRVMPHREGGRLVLEAVTISSCHAYLHAERTKGRLRLHLMNHCSPNNFDNEGQEAEAEAEYGEEAVVVEEDSDDDDQSADHEAESDDDDIWGEELEGSSGNVGGEIGIGKLARPGGCKEDGNSSKGLYNWERFWVAT
ncbi:unnamed protein product [Dovyalis caffra]|uniref:FAF domain-containing protein n=1 Tax=Dovyalis caffra TaxID=77055 RepID=A0AAV1S6V8_9ROSI|nr:unnamed protein product [Dovyalis caffra]